jgi:hypothetical protein
MHLVQVILHLNRSSTIQSSKTKIGDKANIYPFALGDDNTETTFAHVTSNPTYSGLKRREYKGEEKIIEIMVQVRKLMM